MIEIPSKNKQVKAILLVYQRELLEESEMNAGEDGKPQKQNSFQFTSRYETSVWQRIIYI